MGLHIQRPDFSVQLFLLFIRLGEISDVFACETLTGDRSHSSWFGAFRLLPRRCFSNGCWSRKLNFFECGWLFFAWFTFLRDNRAYASDNCGKSEPEGWQKDTQIGLYVKENWIMSLFGIM